MDIKYVSDTPKFNTILQTNQHGNRSYIYILKIYEKIYSNDYEYLENYKKYENKNVNVNFILLECG